MKIKILPIKARISQSTVTSRKNSVSHRQNKAK